MSVYNVNIAWNSGRRGMMCSPDLNVQGKPSPGCIEVATPPEFPNGIPGIWSPEHLYTAAISSCLMTTFLAIAENSNLDFSSFNCQARGILEKVEGKFLMTEVILDTHITVKNEKDLDKARRVLEKSEANCLISNSVQSKITLNPVITVE
jgi:peroxiredoxin-like protein